MRGGENLLEQAVTRHTGNGNGQVKMGPGLQRRVHRVQVGSSGDGVYAGGGVLPQGGGRGELQRRQLAAGGA